MRERLRRWRGGGAAVWTALLVLLGVAVSGGAWLMEVT